MMILKFLLIVSIALEAVLCLEYSPCATKFTNGQCVPIWKCMNVFKYKDDTKYEGFLKSIDCNIPDVEDVRNVCCESTEIARNIEDNPKLKLLDLDNCGQASSDRIAGGERTKPFEYPWMALLQYDGSLNGCGGTLINDRYVLTAAHCIKVLGKELTSVILGEHTIDSEIDCVFKGGEEICTRPVQKIGIEEAISHPMYNRPSRRQNDIGLIRLSRRADLSEDDVVPICLPVKDDLRLKQLGKTIANNYIVTGWGLVEDGPQSNVLLKGKVPFVDARGCQSKLGKTIHEGQFCAGGETASDSKVTVDNCQGDSGGPLQNIGRVNGLRIVQYGIVSYGQRDCGKKELPGVYTDVGYYLDWILDNMRP